MIEIYCDESRQDLLTSSNPTSVYTLIGSLWMTKEIRLDMARRMYALREEYKVWGEIKWSKVSPSKIEFYKSLIALFFDSQKMPYFRCILIDSKKVDNEKYNSGDCELGFYKFYYQVLYHWINENPINCRVFCDIKENKDKNRLKTLHRTLQYTSNGRVEAVQALRSSDTPMLQFCDFLLGMASARLNNSVAQCSAKFALIEYFEKQLGMKISPTNKNVRKYNVFRIKLRGGK
ncbi:MAG: DUF3800 domain-containing protein [Peptostreptococcaceae bacterium]|nr:DUF3800 domain-containing protein [Peptostreptococcaceae bacterium]